MHDYLLEALEQTLNQKIKQLNYISKMDVPKTEGRIRILSDSNQIRIYHIIQKDDKTGYYIKKENLTLAQNIAQNSYNDSVSTILKKQIKDIEKFQKSYNAEAVDRVYERCSLARRKLIHPVELTDKEYIEQWLDKKSPIRNTYPIKKPSITDNGEIVRSKSEELIANKLLALGIPYKYEEPIKIGNELKFPDFTMLRIKTREEVYFEHFGSMDDLNYCEDKLRLIDKYQLNGLEFGKNFFFTLETNDKTINMRAFESMLRTMDLIPPQRAKKPRN